MHPPYDMHCHQVEIVKDTPLYEILEKVTVGVNSYHHQAIKDLAEGLKPMAVSEDGLIEAVYMPGKKFIQAVQWHPEFIYLKDENARKLFETFVQNCKIANSK